MFTLGDFWKILDFLKDPTADTTLDENLRNTAIGDKELATKWFTTAIDQVSFASDDFKRLRKFIIDWYSSFRTIVTTQKNASEAFSLPQTHVEEFIRSFGYPYPENLLSTRTKVAFLLDLVNLYKIKGTPEALISVLEYHDVTDADILEYYLERNESGTLVFRGKSTQRGRISESLVPEKTVTFEEMTSGDPHWFQTQAEINALIASNDIALPSPTPYISVRARMDLQELEITIAILRRKVEDQFYPWYRHGTIPVKDIFVSIVDMSVSLLELYCAIIYTYSRILQAS